MRLHTCIDLSIIKCIEISRYMVVLNGKDY
nr:MAG TPA: hypothetical protein [Caudoviricetes sp.]